MKGKWRENAEKMLGSGTQSGENHAKFFVKGLRNVQNEKQFSE